MLWANFLHFYQPPTQKPYWVKRITTESYRPILKGLLDYPNGRTTLNINSVLVELWEQNGEHDVIDLVRQLLERGLIELTGSAKFHPLLPRIPASEIVRQIELNTKTHRKYFGDLYQPRGFFPPEMGISAEVAKVIANQGFEWMIVDELSFARQEGQVDYSTVYQVAGAETLKVFFRERKMSYKILSGQLGTGQLLIDSLGDRLTKKEFLLTAMDGETFGHHRPGMELLLFEIYKSGTLQTILISDIAEKFPQRKSIELLPSTWALMEKDLERNVPFARWDDLGNPIHKAQWALTELAVQAIQKAKPQGAAFTHVREMLDRALHSDQYWWASAKPWWSLEMIERGAKELRDVVIEAPGIGATQKKKAQELYQEIVFKGFEWQREGIVETLSKQEDEEIRQRTDEGLPQLPPKEIEKIVANLEKEMKLVADRQEFERAAQLRDRIKELRSYAKKA